MGTMCSRGIFTKKCRQQQFFDSDLKGAWHYNHVTSTPIAKNLMLYCRLIYMLSILCVRLTIKVMVGKPESFKVGWYPPPPPQKKKTGSSHLKVTLFKHGISFRYITFKGRKTDFLTNLKSKIKTKIIKMKRKYLLFKEAVCQKRMSLIKLFVNRNYVS